MACPGALPVYLQVVQDTELLTFWLVSTSPWTSVMLFLVWKSICQHTEYLKNSSGCSLIEDAYGALSLIGIQWLYGKVIREKSIWRESLMYFGHRPASFRNIFLENKTWYCLPFAFLSYYNDQCHYSFIITSTFYFLCDSSFPVAWWS